MGILEYIISSVRCLKASKMRTFLTALGIIVGISSVILINTIGSSLGNTIQNVVDDLSGGSMGEIYLNINYDSLEFDSLGYVNFEKLKNIKSKYINNEMLAELEEHFDHKIVRYVNEATDFSGKGFSEENKAFNVSLTGVSSSAAHAARISVLKGRFVIDADIDKKASVAVIPESAAKMMFGKKDPVGKSVSFTDAEGILHELTIIGVYGESEQDKFMIDNSENAVYKLYVPYTYRQETDDTRHVQYLIGGLEDRSHFSDDAKDCLAPYFEGSDFVLYTETTDEISDDINKVVDIITKVISAIAAVSLIVGGIGVMNIMLVSVNERTMEIGVRKAMGANNASIRSQFLTESVMISLIGSVLGIIWGIVQAKFIAIIAVKIADKLSFALSMSLKVPVGAVILAVVFSFAIGIIFGVYPANKAAKMEVVDALRYE